MPEALYRKYRPQVFADVVGQEPIERTLKNALENNKVSHAYLFTGPRGTGKTTTARLLAKALLCADGPTPEPDGTCEDCRLIAEGTHPDVYELDAASRTGVENVREEIISRVSYAPTRGRSKVYIIDEVHMLSPAAFNALLKTLEEPPAHVVFILCTTDPQKVPETIHSRCQRFDFHRIAPESIVTRLGAICVSEGVEFEGEALDLIAQRSEGGLRNALTSLEQIIAYENGRITLAGAERLLGSIDSNELTEIMAYIGKRDIASGFRWVSEYVETGADLAQFVRDMSEHVRNLYILALAGDDAALEVSETARHALSSELQWFGPDRASRMLGVLGDLAAELKTSSNQRLSFEIALTRMVRPDSDLTLEALAERVEALESGYSAVAHVLPGEPAVPLRAANGEVAASAPVTAKAVEVAQVSESAVSEAIPAAASAPEASAAESVPVASAEEPVRAPAATAEQPVAVSEAASAGPGKDALANPAALQRIWQGVMAEVKKKKQAHAVLFMNVKVDYDEPTSTVHVAFPTEATFAFNAAQKPEVHDVVAEALAKVAGGPVNLLFEQRGAAASTAGGVAAAVPAASEAASPAPVQAAVPAASEAPSEVSAQAGASADAAASEGVGAPAQVTASAEAAVPAAEAPAQDSPAQLAPYEDEPPVSVYEADGFDVPFDEDPPAPSTSAPVQSDPPVQEKRVPTMRREPGFEEDTSEKSASPASAAEAPAAGESADIDDVQALLQSGFGAGIVLEEVDE